MIAELSIEYRICVFRARVSVIKIDLGCKTYKPLSGLLKDFI